MATGSTGTETGKPCPPQAGQRLKVKHVVKICVFVVSTDPTGTPLDFSKLHLFTQKKKTLGWMYNSHFFFYSTNVC